MLLADSDAIDTAPLPVLVAVGCVGWLIVRNREAVIRWWTATTGAPVGPILGGWRLRLASDRRAGLPPVDHRRSGLIAGNCRCCLDGTATFAAIAVDACPDSSSIAGVTRTSCA